MYVLYECNGHVDPGQGWSGPEALGGGEGVGGGPEDASHYHACLSSLTKDVRGFTKWWSTWPQEGQA